MPHRSAENSFMFSFVELHIAIMYKYSFAEMKKLITLQSENRLLTSVKYNFSIVVTCALIQFSGCDKIELKGGRINGYTKKGQKKNCL